MSTKHYIHSTSDTQVSAYLDWFRGLPQTERTVMCALHGLGEPALTRREIARALQLPLAAIDLLEAQALERLRRRETALPEAA